jgi:hypothetical protein
MEKLEKYAIFLYLIPMWAALIYCLVKINTEPRPVRHNICTVAEISPDVTPAERERCRMIRGHKL